MTGYGTSFVTVGTGSSSTVIRFEVNAISFSVSNNGTNTTKAGAYIFRNNPVNLSPYSTCNVLISTYNVDDNYPYMRVYNSGGNSVAYVKGVKGREVTLSVDIRSLNVSGWLSISKLVTTNRLNPSGTGYIHRIWFT